MTPEPPLLTVLKCHTQIRGRWVPREFVQVGPIVAVVALDRAARFVLVEQYRPAVGHDVLELPAGGCDPGENPVDAAHRELREETGCRAATMRLLTTYYPAPGLTDEQMYVYRANNVVDGQAHPDDEEDLRVVRLTERECFEALDSGRIVDGKTIIGLMKVLFVAGPGLSR